MTDPRILSSLNHSNWVDNISQRFTHFQPSLIQYKSMGDNTIIGSLSCKIIILLILIPHNLNIVSTYFMILILLITPFLIKSANCQIYISFNNCFKIINIRQSQIISTMRLSRRIPNTLFIFLRGGQMSCALSTKISAQFSFSGREMEEVK